jgi:hypothetical protein
VSAASDRHRLSHAHIPVTPYLRPNFRMADILSQNGM